jgi:radical SAM superfamily enzyme YgiQ (UPF0313 family)
VQYRWFIFSIMTKGDPILPVDDGRTAFTIPRPKKCRLPRSMREAPVLDPDLWPGPPKPRHALLINPFYPKDANASFGKHVLTPTLALTSVASATPADWTVAIWDENLLQGPPPTEPFPSVVGITVHLTFARRAFQLAAWYRARGSRVVLGGLHVLSCPEECAPHADALAVGEGVALWGEILRDVNAGALRPRYEASYRTAYREEPAPRRELLPRDMFLTTTSLIATRGCHNRCGFCYLATEGLDMPYRMLDVDQVVAQFIRRSAHAVFWTTTQAAARAFRALCGAIAPLERIWSAAVTIDVTDDPSLVREMALSGCTAVFIGFESLTGENLDDARKKTPRPEDYARRVKVLHDNGIAVNGSFVLGFDHDRPDVFEKLARWIEDARLECATFHILTPYPGTPLFRQMETEGRLLHRDYDRYDTAHCVFRPRHMLPEDLEAGYAWLYQYLFSLPCIWRRRPERVSEWLPYLGMSLLYKRANIIWPFLIRHRLVATAWRPMVERARRRHLRYRRRLAESGNAAASGAPIYGGV